MGQTEPELLRIEFKNTSTPVEGCDILPYVVMRMPNGDVKSSDTLDNSPGGPLGLQYRWFSCSQLYACSNRNCRLPAKLQFSVPYRLMDENKSMAAKVLPETFFCSRTCFEESWARLRWIQAREKLQNGGESVAEGEGRGDKALVADLDDLLRTVAIGFNKVVQDPETNPIQKKEVGWSRSYTPGKDQIGQVLHLVCRYEHRLAKGEVKIGPPLVAESRSVIAAPAPPPERLMVNVFTRELYTALVRWGNTSGTFRVISYNCLAEIYTTPQHFPWCPTWALAWTYRRQNLTRELQGYCADVICLQEVQADHFEEHFVPVLGSLGYQGVFKSKTREEMGMKGKIDGCATFWLKRRFSVREHHDVEFDSAAYTRQLKDSRALKVLIKGNIGQLVVLDELDGSGCTVIANTHIYWDPDKSEVKVFQVDTFLEEIESLVNRLGEQTSVVFAGDLNSPPDSAVYELVSTGALTRGIHDEIAQDTYSVLDSCRLSHGLSLRSSYTCIGSEPAYTNYTASFVGTLDYVWYSHANLVCVAVLEVPEEKDILADSERGMPNKRRSSDHVAVMAEFSRAK